MAANPEDFLPLKPVELQILVSLRARDLHGYGIVQDAETRGEGRAVPGLVTLYRALQRMEERGLVARVGTVGEEEAAVGDAGDDRRRTYRITGLGARVLRAEALRLGPLVRSALEAGAAPAGEDG